MEIDEKKLGDWWARLNARQNPFTGKRENEWHGEKGKGAYLVLDKILPEEVKDAA